MFRHEYLISIIRHFPGLFVNYILADTLKEGILYPEIFRHASPY